MSSYALSCAVLSLTFGTLLACDVEIFQAVERVFRDDGGLVAGTGFYSAKGHGFMSTRMNPDFHLLCNAVSNNYESIVSNWYCYRTNEVARFSILNAICFSGATMTTNMVSVLLSQGTDGSGAEDLKDLQFLISPYGTPLETYFAMNFDDIVVSNLLNQVRGVALIKGNLIVEQLCNDILSGESKSDYVDRRDSGAL